MPTPRCHHGDDAPRNQNGRCILCHRSYVSRRIEKIKQDPDAAKAYRQKQSNARKKRRAFLRENNPETYQTFLQREAIRNREARKRQAQTLTGYTTAEAADLLGMGMRDLLSRAPEMARIYHAPELKPIRTDNGYRWPRAIVDAVRVTMFTDVRRNPTSYGARFK